jgi:hypothetical protein
MPEFISIFWVLPSMKKYGLCGFYMLKKVSSVLLIFRKKSFFFASDPAPTNDDLTEVGFLITF